VFLQFSGPRPWYWLLHTPNDLDNDMDCPINIYESPEGNISTAIGHSYSIRWVHNIHCFFTAVLMWYIKIKFKTELLFT